MLVLPYDSRIVSPTLVGQMDFRYIEPELRGHIDYLELHIYDMGDVVQALQDKTGCVQYDVQRNSATLSRQR